MGEEQGNGRIRLSWAQVVTVVAWLVGGLMAYGALDARIRVLEDRFLRLTADISEVKTDVKTLLQRGDR